MLSPCGRNLTLQVIKGIAEKTHTAGLRREDYEKNYAGKWVSSKVSALSKARNG